MSGTAKENKGIHITATEEIIVFANNKRFATSDSFLALPVDVLGKDYYVPSYPGSSQFGLYFIHITYIFANT
jgi:hypothetical protein